MDHVSEMARHLDAVLPIESVLRQATAFLDACAWTLEISDDHFVNIPQGTTLVVRSRAFVKADMSDYVLLDDHFEAVVHVGEAEGLRRAKYAVLRMYFNAEGKFVTEDRYDKFS
ncbi:MAG: hypothetical protein ACRD9R_08810 [Pyrinomonadaceae bacterium]